jgi:hypothetical protein
MRAGYPVKSTKTISHREGPTSRLKNRSRPGQGSRSRWFGTATASRTAFKYGSSSAWPLRGFRICRSQVSSNNTTRTPSGLTTSAGSGGWSPCRRSIEAGSSRTRAPAQSLLEHGRRRLRTSLDPSRLRCPRILRARHACRQSSMGDTGLELGSGAHVGPYSPVLLAHGALRSAQVRSNCYQNCYQGQGQAATVE